MMEIYVGMPLCKFFFLFMQTFLLIGIKTRDVIMAVHEDAHVEKKKTSLFV